MVIVIYRCLLFVCDLFLALLCIRALSSWLLGMNNGVINWISNISIRLTEFLVGPCRKLISKYNNGMIDWSVLLAFLVVVLFRDISQRLMLQFLIF